MHQVELICEKEIPVIKEVYIENILEGLKKDVSIIFVPYEQVLEAMRGRGKDPLGPTKEYSSDRFE